MKYLEFIDNVKTMLTYSGEQIQDYYEIIMFEVITELEISKKDFYIIKNPSFVDNNGNNKFTYTKALSKFADECDYINIKEILLEEFNKYNVIYLYNISIYKSKDPECNTDINIIRCRGYFE